MPLTLGLLGRGRLATTIREVAAPRDDVRVAWSTGREDDARTLEPVDVAVDVSAADAVVTHLAWARSSGTPLVIGTTGWDTDLLLDLGPEQRVLVAPNFSLGLALVLRLARVLGGYAVSGLVADEVDLAVTDTHHRHKADAPSGTALALRRALATGAGRDPHHVQTTSLRLGEVVGEHEVVAASALETLTVRHTAHRRELFATGALTAARWLADRTTPGLTTLDDLAEDHLRRLLDGPTEEGPR